MELIQLQCFVALAKTLNFKKAADMVFISQSTMTRYISGLESELKVSLFERGKMFSSTRLTSAGRFFLPKAEELLQNARSVMDDMTQFSSVSFDQQPLQVGIDMRLSHGQIPDLIYDYSKTLPYSLSMQTITEEQLPELLNQGTLDLGIAIHVDGKYLNAISYQAITELHLMIHIHQDVLTRYKSRDPLEILKNEKIISANTDIKINAHIMSLLYNMGIQPSFMFCESPYEIDFLVKTSKGISILPDTGNSADPKICQIPIPKEYGSLIVYGLFPYEVPETASLVDYLKEKLNPELP